jgi:hypothetical protein
MRRSRRPSPGDSAGVADGIYARAAEGDAAFLPPDLVQDIRRIPSPFQGHRTSWAC